MPNSFDRFKLIAEIQALAQSGLAYTQNEYDKERYHRLIHISAQLASEYTPLPIEKLHQLFSDEKGYATPKLDVRSFVLKDDKILLVKERLDGRWSLPGGWADINASPAENAIRETKEEAGYDVTVKRLLALWDKRKHDHPPEWPHIYKCFFHCEIISGEPTINLEISDIDFFKLDNLPELSLPRITASQLKRLYDLAHLSDIVAFD